MAAVASHHWHKNPVPAIRFLGDGVTLLSGGEETVLVFWNTLFQRRHFVPRVGGPIKSIVASPNHALYALLLGNNLIQLINSTTRDIQYSIQGLQTRKFAVRKTTLLSTFVEIGLIQPLYINQNASWHTNPATSILHSAQHQALYNFTTIR